MFYLKIYTDTYDSERKMFIFKIDDKETTDDATD